MNNILFTCSMLCLISSAVSTAAQHDSVSFYSFEYSGETPGRKSAGPGEYQNPILAGFYPDPSICQVGRDYYLVNSTFAYFPGLPIFHSRDLVNWQQIGHAIDRADQLNYMVRGVSEGIFAPAIAYHEGTFYIVSTMVGSNGNFVITAQNPDGPWSDPVPLNFPGIDPSLFFDDDGRAWIVNNDMPDSKVLYEGHRAIRIQEFDVEEKRVIGPRKVIVDGGVDISKRPIWIEGPHVYKHDGWYYLSAAEGGTGPDHSQVIFRSKQVDGPYEPWDQNPILTQRAMDPEAPGAVTCTGHADLVEGPDKKWWAVFLGVRPYGGRFSLMGRETFLLPVEWTTDGWPRILQGGKRVPLVNKSPAGASVIHALAPPLSGDFTWRDDFTSDKLSPTWIMLRAPKEAWWSLDPITSSLNLTARNEQLSGNGNPSFLSRRIQHPHFTATTELEMPKTAGVTAGLAIFQNETHSYLLGVRKDGEEAEIFLERQKGGNAKTVKSSPLPAASRLKLRVVIRDSQCNFEFAIDSGPWRSFVSNADATLLTTDVAGGFVGATVGMHVRAERRMPGDKERQ